MRLVLCAYALAALGLVLNGCSGGGGGSPPPPSAPVVTIPDMGAYLATARCADGRLAVLAGCPGAPQRASDPMLWRRADASGHTDGQLSDSFVSDAGDYYVQTYSYPPNGPFVAAHGDGGDVAVVESDHVRFAYTQNGAPGGGTIAGYWVGSGCLLGTGWLVFDRYAPTGAWRSQIARLAGSVTRNACPPLNPAFTRWRAETAIVPFTVLGASRPVSLPVIVSEHYAGVSIAGSASMERYVLGRSVGRIAWEAWATQPPPVPVTWACGGIAPWNGPPTSGWYLRDRRCLTAIVPGNGMAGAQFNWPAQPFVP